MYFKDRNHAGETLADALLEEWKELNPIVVALPRGGVPVAYPIARQLRAPLDVLLVRKLGAPDNPEYALGAVAEDGQFWVNREALDYFKPSKAEVNEAVRLAVLEMERQEKIFRRGRAPLEVKNRPVILVDDGLATGSTMLAAVASLKARGASEIAVVVPVASREAVGLLEGEVSWIYAAHEPEFLRSVGEWYEDFEQVSDEDVTELIRSGPETPKGPVSRREDVVAAIQSSAKPITGPDDLSKLVAVLKDKKVIMLGESTHGTAEFYRIRAALSEILVRDHGFTFVAVEGDWPDATRLRRYIQKSEDSSAQEVLQGIHRWPMWMWANLEVAEFAEALKPYQAAFYGLDVYSLFESMEEVLLYLKEANPFLARRIAERYACFNAFGGDEIAYAKSLLHDPEGCQTQVVANLEDILRMRIAEGKKNGHDIFDAAQNARIVKNAESYYRAMLRGDAGSWNVRDQHMQETLERLIEHHGPDTKAIVWAHNTHVGDYRATDMLGEGYVNLGGLARQRFGAQNVALVGFGTYQGKVIAGHAWGAAEEVMSIPPAKAGSIEDSFHIALERLRLPSCFLVFDSKMREGALSRTLGHRAIGVVYDPKHEGRGQYVPTVLADRYDAFVFIDQTTAVHPLHGVLEYGDIPQAWPMGQ